MGEWICVADVLPPALKPVLLYSDCGKMNVGAYNDLYMAFGVMDQYFGKVTHWMELPEEPKNV